ncbi:MAG: PIN domain-containing protein [Dehalococcoidia bacterium]|nr:PIN domain-containing protein [Dehalococcoidia bacterium]
MPVKVVDASVVVALAFKEPRAREAESLLQGADLFAPTLFPYELANVARTKMTRGGADPVEAEAGLQLGLDLGIRFVTPDFQAVLRLALETGLTAYDAAYLQVARALDAELVTFDDRLRAAARRP